MLTTCPYKLLGCKVALTTAMLLCSITSSVGLSQMPQRREPLVVDPGNNETINAELSTQAAPRVFHANINEDAKVGLVGVAADAGDRKLIILIAHRGTRELRTVSQRRLKTAQSYLRSTHAIPLDRILIAEGSPVAGSGRIDVYIDGKLHSSFRFFKRNRDFAPEP